MISVLMPVYNAEKYIENTLKSVQAQTYTDFEVIMVDDGATDSSPAICDRWVDADSRFKVIHKKNEGVSVARNTALANVSGDYIFFMDSDDLIVPETLEELYDALIRNDADIATGCLFYVDKYGNPIDKLNEECPIKKDEILTNTEYLAKLCEHGANFYCTHTSKLFRKELYDGIIFPAGKINEDEATIHEVIYKCNKIITLAKPYYHYIKHFVSITGANFSIRNLDREDAYIGRIEFFLEKGLNDLADKTALQNLDRAVLHFTQSITFGLYHGEAKDRLLSTFRICYKYAKNCKNLSFYEKRVMAIAWLIVRKPEIYEKYVLLRIKLMKMLGLEKK